MRRPCAAKVDEMLQVLGRYIDGAAARAGLLGTAAGSPLPNLAPPKPAAPKAQTPSQSVEDEAAADAKMTADGFYAHFALQAPPMVTGDPSAHAVLDDLALHAPKARAEQPHANRISHANRIRAHRRPVLNHLLTLG